VSTPISDLTASGTGRTDIYDDLGTGTLLGSDEEAAFNSPAVVNLNADGLAAIVAAQGGSIAIGGAIDSPVGPYDFRFGYSGGSGMIKQLELDFATLDFYVVNVGAGETLTARTIAPASGPGQFENNLDSAILLYDAMGNLVEPHVSTKDGVNDFVSYTSAAGGTYYVVVAGVNNSTGEYALSVSVGAGSSPSPLHADPVASDSPVARESLSPAGPMSQARQVAVAAVPGAIMTLTSTPSRPAAQAPTRTRPGTTGVDLALAAIGIDPSAPDHESFVEALTWDLLLTSRRRLLLARA
jgi:hypothetical protein